jgi:hypothetical protein
MTDATTPKLTVRQERFLTALFAEGTVRRAARRCGYPERTCRTWRRLEAFAAAERALRADLRAGSVGQLHAAAPRVTRELIRLALRSPDAKVRLGAIRCVQAFLHKGAELLDIDVRLTAVEETQRQNGGRR